MIGVLTSLVTRATVEDPNVPLNAENISDILGGTKTDSGVVVTHKKALTYDAWYRGIALISGYIAKTPLYVYRREFGSDGEETGKARAKDHAGYPLLRRKPNAEMTALVFKRVLQSHICALGNGYAYIYRNADATPRELIPMDPTAVTPVRANGKLWYVCRFLSGEQRRLSPRDVFHVHGLGYDGLRGYSVLDMAKESIGLHIGERQYGSRFFKNNARPSVVIEHPAKLTDDQEKHLRDSWNRMHQGLDNAHRTAVLEGGMKLHEFTINARDAQLLESRGFGVRETANFLGLPPHKLGDSSRTSYNSLEQENQAFLDDSLDDWFSAWEEEAFDKILSEREKIAETHFVEFLRQSLIRANMTARGAYYAKATGGKAWITPNEVRRMENMDASEDEDADSLAVPLNVKQAGAGGFASSHRQLLNDVLGRMVRRVGVHARRAAKRPATFLDWLEALDSDHGETIRAALSPALGVIALHTGEDPEQRTRALCTELLAGIRALLTHIYDTVTEREFASEIDRAMTEIEQNPDLWIEEEQNDAANRNSRND